MAHYQWEYKMGSRRAHLVLPQELIEEIDSVVGPRGRSAFLVETARAELRRRRLLTFLHDDQPAWNESDHPELGAGSGAWVKLFVQKVKSASRRQMRPSSENAQNDSAARHDSFDRGAARGRTADCCWRIWSLVVTCSRPPRTT
jgi:hypothetical protein